MKTLIRLVGFLLLIVAVAVSAFAVRPKAPVQKGKAAVGKVDSSKRKVDKQSSKGGRAQAGSKGQASAESGSSKSKDAGSASLKLPPPPAGVSVETFTVNGVSFEMVLVEGGILETAANDPESFDLESLDLDNYDWEMPVHRETVGTFWIGRTEVTQALWEAVMGSNPSYSKGANLPVENISWNDCKEFIERLNRETGKAFSLPSEAEWEYAARGGNRSQGYTYSGSNDIGSVAWYSGNSEWESHPVATKLANELGIYDMSGNVWEWCWDCWRDNFSAPYNYSYRDLRGGSWNDTPTFCRVDNRFYHSPNGSLGYFGLRLTR